MASIANIVDSFRLSPNQERLFRRLRAGKTVTPVGQDKRSMTVLIEWELAAPKPDAPGSFILGDRGQTMAHHFRESGLMDEIAPGVFRFKEGAR